MDTDGDLVCDTLDPDDDGDGYSDSDETTNCQSASDPLDAGSTPVDTDGDLACDYLDADDDNDSIVRATIDLAHTLGLNVVAEGVENRVVYERLRGMGCDFGQGYYIGKPLAKAAIAGWLQAGHGLLQSS